MAKLISAPLMFRVSLSVLHLAGLLLLDSSTGFEVSFSVFYLVPVLLAGGTISFRAGQAMALASAAAWGYLDLASGHVYSAAWIPVWNSVMRLAFFLIINELVERVRRAHQREQTFASTDSLTGIANGRVFKERVNQTITQIRRHQRPFTIAYIDLDRFKQVNDTFGHAEGDRLLRTVATVIQGHLRASDLLARLGGDEFGILMPETGAEQARVSLERLSTALMPQVGERWGVGATFGAVTFSQAPEDYDSAVRRADDLMYRGKAEGRGRVLLATWPESAETEQRGSQVEEKTVS
jgi:diguanylate cyclase (GGDEF)-like protein